jgi:putative spermidine/putrescine transport system substrate-binding protein
VGATKGLFMMIKRTKRAVLSIALATFAVALAAAVSVAATQKSQKLEPSMVFAAAGGSFEAGFDKCVMTGFERSTGVKVTYQAAQPVQNLALVAAQRSNPTIDVIWTSNAEQYVGSHHGFFAPLPYKSIPNTRDVPAAILKKIRFGFDKSAIPTARGVAGIEYNTKLFAANGWAPPTSWKDLWDPKYKGHVAIYTISIPFAQAFLVTMAKLNGGSESKIDAGFARLAALKPNLYAIYSTAAQMDQGFQSGQVWIGLNSGARTHDFKASGASVEYVAPKEGSLALDLSVDIVKNAPHPNAARAFINFLLSRQAQSCLPSGVGYAPVNQKAQVPAELAPYLPGTDVKIAKTYWPTMEHNLASWVDRWNQVMK